MGVSTFYKPLGDSGRIEKFDIAGFYSGLFLAMKVFSASLLFNSRGFRDPLNLSKL